MVKSPFKKIGRRFKRKAKNVASQITRTTNRVASTTNSAISTVERSANKSVGSVSRLVDKLLNGANTFSPSAKALLKSHGSKRIVSMSIVRNPIPAPVQGVLDTFGGRIGVDRLMHLALVWTLEDGTRGVLEKNEVINIARGPLKVTPSGASMEIAGPFSNLNTMMTKTKAKMGRLMFSYSVTNNCQKFVEAVLLSNELNTEENLKFVIQDTDNLFKGKANLRKFSNTVTDIAGRANIAFQGGSIRPYQRQPRGTVVNMGPIRGAGFDDDECACLLKKGVVCRN